MSFSFTPSFDFSIPKAALCLPMGALKEGFDLKKTEHASRDVEFALVAKTASAAAPLFDIEKLVKIAANYPYIEPGVIEALAEDELSVVSIRAFQVFSRTIIGAENLFSKKQRIWEKATQIAKGCSSFMKESILITDEYWHEVLQKNHPYGPDIEDYFGIWKRKKDIHYSFDVYMDLLEPRHRPSSSVAYLDQTQRQEFEVTIVDGKLYNLNGPVDSSIYKTDKKEGYAIYVISCDLKMYVGPYLRGKFHHSSFLSGSPVLGAGEIFTSKDGTILLISSKSGHYQPNAMQLHNTFEFLEAHGVNLAKVGLIENGAGSSITRHDSISAFVETSPSPSPTSHLRIRLQSSPTGFRVTGAASSSPLPLGSPLGFSFATPFETAEALSGGGEGHASPAKLGPASSFPINGGKTLLRVQAKAPFAEGVDASGGMWL